MVFHKATMEDKNAIHSVIKRTVEEVYPKYYSKGIVDFFLSIHNLKTIRDRINDDIVIWAEDNGEITGTGCLSYDCISSVYVLPGFSGRGIGTTIMRKLESIARDNGHKRLRIDSSAPAERFYGSLGYIEVAEKTCAALCGDILTYKIMEKDLI